MKLVLTKLKRSLRVPRVFLQMRRKFPYKFDLRNDFPELSVELASPVIWKRPDIHSLQGDAASKFVNTPGAHKWHHYFAIYDELFARLRSKPIVLLEIGVYRGVSIQAWHQYFHPDSIIVGVDINPDCLKYQDIKANVHVRIGSQSDAAFLALVTKEFGPFDLIIDDGSHITSHMIASFNHLFDTGLKDGGLYFAEDTHTNFWRNYRDSKRSFVDFCFCLVKCMHAHYASGGTDELHFRVGESNSLPFVEVPKITTLIEEIRFFDSVVAITKAINKQLSQSQHW